MDTTVHNPRRSTLPLLPLPFLLDFYFSLPHLIHRVAYRQQVLIDLKMPVGKSFIAPAFYYPFPGLETEFSKLSAL